MARLKQLETAQNAQILALEQLPDGTGSGAAAAMRARITARFAELHADREQAEAQLAALAAVTPKAADPTLLEELPLVGDILAALPPDLKTRLFDAFDLQILWDKPGAQATVYAEITDATLRALPGILDPGQDGYDDTTELSPGEPAAVEDLFEYPIRYQIFRRSPIFHDLFGARSTTARWRTTTHTGSTEGPDHPRRSGRRARYRGRRSLQYLSNAQ
jgi:hypothetical protein